MSEVDRIIIEILAKYILMNRLHYERVVFRRSRNIENSEMLYKLSDMVHNFPEFIGKSISESLVSELQGIGDPTYLLDEYRNIDQYLIPEIVAISKSFDHLKEIVGLNPDQIEPYLRKRDAETVHKRAHGNQTFGSD